MPEKCTVEVGVKVYFYHYIIQASIKWLHGFDDFLVVHWPSLYLVQDLNSLYCLESPLFLIFLRSCFFK